MTIGTNDLREEYTATAGQTVFSFGFRVFADTDLNVYKTANGAAYNDANDLITAYTVSRNADQSASPGGSITLTSGATLDDKLTIVSNVPETRTTDFQTGGLFSPELADNEFDREVTLAKQAGAKAGRAMLAPVSEQNAGDLALDDSVTRANKLLAFTGTGAPTVTNSTKAEIDTAVSAINAGAVTQAVNHIAMGTLAETTGAYDLVYQIANDLYTPSLNDVITVNRYNASAKIKPVKWLLSDNNYTSTPSGTASADVNGRKHYAAGRNDGDGKSYVETGSGTGVFYQLKLASNVKDPVYFGAAANYNPTTKTGTDDTAAVQAMFASLEDGDIINLDGYIRYGRTNADIKTVDGVASYIAVASGINNLRVQGSGVLYQDYSTTNTVGVAFKDCDDLHFDYPVFDGNFRYTAAQPISYSQHLVHVIGGKRHTGGFIVRNSSNVGYLITNQYGDTGAGYINAELNAHSYGALISENCLQNSTYGTALSRISVDSVISINPLVAGLKLSSRMSAGAPSWAGKGVSIGAIQVAFDSTYVIPNKSDDSGLNDALSGLDYVSGYRDVSIGRVLLDFENVTIASNGVKCFPQDTNDTTRRAGPLHVNHLNCRNQGAVNSVVLAMDNEATAVNIDVLEYENVSKVVEIDDYVTTGAQLKKLKWLKIGKIIGDDLDRNAINVIDYDADCIEIGQLQATYAASYANQCIRVDATCDLNRFVVDDIDTNSVVTILGDVNEYIRVGGKIDAAGQAADPLTINMDTLSSSLVYDLSDLKIVGDDDSFRKVYLNNVNSIRVNQNTDISGVPKGYAIANFNEFHIADNCHKYADLTVLQPWQFSGTLGSIDGNFSYEGSPNSTQIADMGCKYTAKALGLQYKKTSGAGAATGWTTY